jgi:hypothetical protein
MRLIIILVILLTYTSAYSAVLFEADFEDYTSAWEDAGAVGHAIAGTHNGSDPGVGVPAPFTGYINHHADNSIRIDDGYGRDGGYGVRIGMNYGGITDQVGLAVYLPNASGVYDYQGHDEIYVRFYVKYSQGFDWISPSGTFYYHKWLRVWQNVPENRIKGNASEGDEPDQNMSREENTGYTVIGMGEDNYGEFSPYNYGMFSRDMDNSSSGEAIGRWNYSYSSGANGFLENYYGNIDSSGEFEETQDWHCWEFYIKLSEEGQDNGEYTVWIDGNEQSDSGFRMRQNPSQNPATGDDTHGPAEKLGVGINYISIMDNADSYYWSEQQYIYLDDIVISTTYIGPIGVSGNSSLSTGTGSFTTGNGAIQ